MADGFYFLRDGEQLGPYSLNEAVGQFTLDYADGYYVGTESAPFQVINNRLDELESSSFSGGSLVFGIIFGICIGLVVVNIIDFIKSIK